LKYFFSTQKLITQIHKTKSVRLNGHTSFEFQTRNYLAVRMVADVTETRNVIPSLEFKIFMTTKS